MTLFPAWTPFLDPIPIWSNAVWPWLLLPLTIAVALVYKSIKCRSMRQVPREAASIAIWIVVGMSIAGGILAGVVRAMEW
jgi:cation transporter-like permease